ncbi:MAG: glycosyltransferase family 39 protein [Anaerolineae bacterium]
MGYCCYSLKRLNLVVTIAVVLVQTVGAYFFGSGFDFALFREATLDHNPYVWLPAYGYWLLRPIMLLPSRLSLIIIVLISSSLMAYTGYKLTGSGLPALLSSAGFLSAETGQIDGFVALGLVLGVLACERRKPHLLGGALLLMSLKPHITLVAAVWLIVYLRDWRTLLIPAGVFLLSLLTDGLWPLGLLQSPPHVTMVPHNISLWRLCGPSLLPLLALPFLFGRRDPRRAVTLAVAASALAMPYYNFYSLDVLFGVGVSPWLVPLTYIPFLPWPAQWEAWHVLVLAFVPALGLILLLVRQRSGWRRSRWLRSWYRPLLILLTAFLARTIHLQGRALWYDESFAALYASLSPGQMIYGTVAPVAGAGAADVHPLLYYFLLHGWMGLVGHSPLALRFLSVALGMIAVALLWRLAAWCFGRRTGLVVGLLAAVNPFHVAYSQEARMYGLLGLAAVTAAWGLLRALEGAEEQGTTRNTQHATRDTFHVLGHWSLFIVGAALTLYAHNLGAFVLLAFHLLVVVRRRWWRRLPALALADLAALALFGPWLVLVLPGQVGFVGRGYWLTPPGVEEAVRAIMLPLLTFYEPAPLWLLGLSLFTGVLLLTLLILRLWRTRSRAGWFLLLCWVPILLILLASLWRPVYLERALLPSELFYLVSVGWLLARGGLPRLLRLALALLLALATLGALGVHYTYARFPRPPFARLTAFLRERVTHGEVVVHDNKLTFFPAHYYDPALPQTFCPDLPGSGSNTLALPTQEALGLFATPISQTVASGVTGVWYVAFDRTWEEYRVLGYADAPNRTWLRARCHREGEVHTIADLEIYHFANCEAEP